MDDVQPNEGQGGTPYDSYLESVPQEARGAAEQWFADTSKSMNGKLEELATLQRERAEYDGLNLGSRDELEPLLQFRDNQLGSQEAFDAWFAERAREKGWTQAEAEAEAELTQEGLTEQQARELASEQINTLLNPLQEQLAEVQFNQAVDVETEAIAQEMKLLESETGKKFTEDQKAWIYANGEKYSYDRQGNELPVGDISWVRKGLEEFERMGAAFQRDFVERSSQQPAAAMTTGGSARFQPPTNFDDAQKAARERWKQMQT